MGETKTDVTVGAFCLDLTEVTVAAYEKCVTAGQCTEPTPNSTTSGYPLDAGCNWKRAGYALHPVNCVKWSQAVSFCGADGRRLPSEEEWEWAARGGEKAWTYPWGQDAPTADKLNACGSECPPAWTVKASIKTTPTYPENDGFPETAPVGSFPKGASRWLSLDLAGNVAEWTSTLRDVVTKGTRVIRGGSFGGSINFNGSIGPSLDYSAAHAVAEGPFASGPGLGFRCAKGL
jgi:formylglycine-generating enzyme required for sulfatase activity